MEREMMGLYVSGHPLDEYLAMIEKKATLTSKDLNVEKNTDETESEVDEATNLEQYDGKEATMCGLVTNLKKIYTKSNRQMAFSDFEDLYGDIEAVFFPNVYEKYANTINSDKVVEVKGKISLKENEKSKILVDTIKELSKEEKIYVKITTEQSEYDKEIAKLFEVLKEYPGDTPVYAYFEKTKEYKGLARQWWVTPTNELTTKLTNTFGFGNVKIV